MPWSYSDVIALSYDPLLNTIVTHYSDNMTVRWRLESLKEEDSDALKKKP
jgi:hypothetical protein